MATWIGGCLCGRVRYEAIGDPVRSGLCHCRNCQHYTGSAFEPFVIFATASVTVTGELSTFEHRGDSGRIVGRCFCPNCGSGIVNLDPTHGMMVILVGTLDDPTVFQPTIEIQCDTALAWAHFVSDRKRFSGMPG